MVWDRRVGGLGLFRWRLFKFAMRKVGVGVRRVWLGTETIMRGLLCRRNVLELKYTAKTGYRVAMIRV
jgi:hypothetical protein